MSGDDERRTESGADEAPVRPRVLIGDPDVFAQRAVTRVLEQDGRLEVCATARDAAETVAAAVATVPDICLLEVSMPGGGLAAAWELTARLPETRVVMLTARDEHDVLMEALELGVAGYLLKGAVLTWLPNALMDVHRGTFAMPRRLTNRVVQQLRTAEPRRRALLGANSRLTSREWQVLDLIANGLSTRQVAEQLTLSPTAVRVHIAAVVRKLGVESRHEAIELFRRAEEPDAADFTLHSA